MGVRLFGVHSGLWLVWDTINGLSNGFERLDSLRASFRVQS